MMRQRVIGTWIGAGCFLLTAAAVVRGNEVMEWTIAGETRQAIVIPASKPEKNGSPVVLVFHGHGGTMQNMERKGFQTEWPEAIVVCPQGLPTASLRDPEGKQSGWQPRRGANNDRDLKLVDAILKTLRQKYQIDDRRVFATGHSNGGGFVYLLWGERSKELAGIGPVAAGAMAIRNATDLKPMPVIHIAGENDEIVRIENQRRSMTQVRRMNHCDPDGTAWGTSGNLVGTFYQSSVGTPLVAVIHPGAHAYPAEAPAMIVRFFKEVSKTEQR